MKQISIGVGSVLMMICIGFGMASAESAVQCLDLSPTIKAGGKFTEPISARALTDTENQQVRTMLESLQGHWVGDATEVTCNLADIEEQEIDAFTLKAEAKMDRSGDFLMDAEFYSAKEHTHHQEALRLYLNTQFLRINYDSGAGDVQLIDVSENKIELRYLIRMQNRGNAGGIYNEFFYRIEKSTSGFSIHQHIYTQGRLSAQYEWRFRRN